jgi:hypothetical protein
MCGRLCVYLFYRNSPTARLFRAASWQIASGILGINAVPGKAVSLATITLPIGTIAFGLDMRTVATLLTPAPRPTPTLEVVPMANAKARQVSFFFFFFFTFIRSLLV